jgi:hypothetical protein
MLVLLLGQKAPDEGEEFSDEKSTRFGFLGALSSKQGEKGIGGRFEVLVGILEAL